MIDVFTLRIVAGVLLASSFLLIYVVNFTGEKVTESYETRTEVPAATSIEVVGGLVAIEIPLIAVILFMVLPATVSETVLNFHWLGDTFVQVIGMLLYVGGGALLIWNARHLGKFDIGKVAVAEDHVLVETGPYARVRHPGYTARFLIALAVSFILLNAVLYVNVVVAAGFYVQRARLEEKLLS